jgi:hypothetical protein
MKTNQIWNFIGIAIVLSFVLGILIHFNTILTALGLIQETPEDIRQSIGAASTIAEVLVSSLVAFCTFLINYSLLSD